MADPNLKKTIGIAGLIVVLAIIVLMGGAIIGGTGFSKTLRQDTTALAVQFALPQNGTSTAVGATGTYSYLQTVTTPCVNTTNSSITYEIGNYTVNEGGVDGGTVSLGATDADSEEGRTVNCTISYLAGTTGQATADKFESGLYVFGTFVGIIALAFIGKIVLGLFKSE